LLFYFYLSLSIACLEVQSNIQNEISKPFNFLFWILLSDIIVVFLTRLH